jgi:hypothetical protein
LADQNHCPCPHQWIQTNPFIPAWVQQMPTSTASTPINPPVVPNPVFPATATVPMCTPLEIRKLHHNSILVTVSIPAESIITLPTPALEIKMIRKNLKITQCRFFGSVMPVRGIPVDTSKLFIGGTVRKDIQFSEVMHKTATTVEGTIRDFVVDIPISCVVDLGKHIRHTTHFDRQEEYGFSRETPLPTGFSSKEKMLSRDFSEFNIVSQEHLNRLPHCELIFSQINEMDDALDRVPLQGGPFEEGTFRILQEKMVVLIQLKITLPTEINHRDPSCERNERRERRTIL